MDALVLLILFGLMWLAALLLFGFAVSLVQHAVLDRACVAAPEQAACRARLDSDGPG